ncbi:MAG: membrane lipoprotein lipid attachment site-containing protein [Bacteroidia bacterium]|nr:membrane lipoprotein lipid attachment site-containing protein [Bacteroidia bacterium]
MKKIVIIISALTILASCSSKSEDFIGVHNFKIMATYEVKDTTEFVNSIYGSSPLTLKVKKLIPFKIDLFESGEEIKGTLTIVKYQTQKVLETINKVDETKVDLKNIHIINDTLVSEIAGRKHPTELKLTKSNGNIYLIVLRNDEDDVREECNKFATISESNIVYRELIGNSKESEIIKESNNCSVEKAVNLYLENGYNQTKKGYLKQILSVEPRK